MGYKFVADEHDYMAATRELLVMDRDDLDFELRDIDEAILDHLEAGWRTRRWLADALDVSPDYVYQRVDLLAKLGVVEVIHDGFYRLAESEPDVDDPIDAVASTIATGRSDAEVDANRELVRVATRWLRAQDATIQKSDAPLAEWQAADASPRAPRSEKQLWNELVVQAWRASECVADTDRTFTWVGEES